MRSAASEKRFRPRTANAPSNGNAADGNPQWDSCRTKGRRVEQDESRKPLRQRGRGAHPDRTAPIVSKKGDVPQVEAGDEAFEIRDMLCQAIGIILRLVGKATADVIDGQDAIVGRQGLDQVSPGKAPSGIAVDQEERWPRTLVDIVISQSVEIEELRSGRGTRPRTLLASGVLALGPDKPLRPA